MSNPGTQVFYFGDSLTDVGVIFGALVEGLTAEILPVLLAGLGPEATLEEIAAAQAQAAFLAEQQARAELQASGFGPQNALTNEFTHATYFGQASGATVINFANAGARALGTQEPFGDGTGYDSNLGAQLDRFAFATGGAVAPGSKAVLFIGANDFRDEIGETLEDPNDSILQVIDAVVATIGNLLPVLEDAARTLDAAGVETVYFGSLPLSTFFPSTDGFDDLVAGVSDALVGIYNGLLSATAQSLQSEGIDVQIIDYAAVAKAITEDPTGFGIVADRSDLLVDGSAFDGDQVAFWDPIHPTEAAHQAWGAYTEFVMAGGSTASLSDLGTFNVQDSGDNAVFANGGNDTLLALGGDDIVFGGTGADKVFAGRGNDIVSGGAGDDGLHGHGGDDILAGGGGDDIVRGGAGADVLIDGLGNDIMRGGGGADTFIFVQGTLEGEATRTTDDFRGGGGLDTLYLVLDATTFDAFGTNEAASTLADLGILTRSIETVVAIDGRDQVESVLGGASWFQDADFWGLIPAPAPDLIV